MTNKILVAGGTGDLGARIITTLLKRGANVRAIVRQGASKDKIDGLTKQGVEVAEVDMMDLSQVTKACEGVTCVVSALAGLHDVIIDTQSLLLDAAVAAGVPRFIPSDYSSDFTQLTPGENRNFDLRREFHAILDKAPIKATTIFNGAFAEILTYNIPFLDFKKKINGYWGSVDWKVDFTTMDDAAAYTAAAAMDDSSPRILRIASFQISAKEMAKVASELMHEHYQPVSFGTVESLTEQNKMDRAAHPEGENELYPNWQRGQYMQSMFSSQMKALDNDRYPDIKWTTVQEMLGKKQ